MVRFAVSKILKPCMRCSLRFRLQTAPQTPINLTTHMNVRGAWQPLEGEGSPALSSGHIGTSRGVWKVHFYSPKRLCHNGPIICNRHFKGSPFSKPDNYKAMRCRLAFHWTPTICTVGSLSKLLFVEWG